MSLTWESAGTDEPRDQNATSALAPHAYWSLGPFGEWFVELIVLDDALDEIPGAGVALGRFPSESAAKSAAQRWENDREVSR